MRRSASPTASRRGPRGSGQRRAAQAAEERRAVGRSRVRMRLESIQVYNRRVLFASHREAVASVRGWLRSCEVAEGRAAVSCVGGEPVGCRQRSRRGSLILPHIPRHWRRSWERGGAGRTPSCSVHPKAVATGGSSEDSVTIATPARQGTSTPSDASPPIKTIGLFHHARLARSVCSSNDDARARIDSCEGGLGVGGPRQPVGPTAAPPLSGIESAPKALERQVVSRAAARWRPYAGAKLRACARQSSSISAGNPASQTGPPRPDVER